MHGSVVRSWMGVTIGDFEALLSFAGYTHEHPDDPFPEFVQGPAIALSEYDLDIH